MVDTRDAAFRDQVPSDVEFIDLGCHSFCLSGYLHDAEAESFGRMVLPLLRHRNPQRIAA